MCEKEKKEKKEGNYACPRCNCRVVYDLSISRMSIAVLQQNHDGQGFFAEEIASDGQIKNCLFRCVDCGFEFDNPVWISAESYKGL